MFKHEGKTWLYLLGVVIMFAILLFLTINFYIPFLRGEKKALPVVIGDKRPDFSLDENSNYRAIIKTNYGEINIDLYEKLAPNNVNNFVQLAESGYYKDTKFHRLVPNLLIHGGDRNTLDDDSRNDGLGHPGYLIDDEVNWDSISLNTARRNQLAEQGYRSNNNVNSAPLQRYSIAMANDGPNTNGSQFFIIFSSFTDPRIASMSGQYTVIGEVIGGYSVLDKIANIPITSTELTKYTPSEDIVIEEVQILSN